PLNVQFYRCESRFVTEPLQDLLEKTDNFGLVVMDGKDATVALLHGTKVKVLRRLHSTAHAKHHKGGQCLHEDSLVQLEDGVVVSIKDVFEKQRLSACDFSSWKSVFAKVARKFKRKAKTAYRLDAKNPRLSVVATGEHRFFVVNKKGVVEKAVAELKEGDFLLAVKPSHSNGLLSRKGGKTASALERVNGDFILSELKNKTKVPAEGFFYDLSLPSTRNFVANGFIVHNSAARYQRIADEEIDVYYRRVGSAMDAFVGQKNFQGVIVGGPGPAKENFLKAKTYNYQLKVLGVVDTGYADEYGIRELLDKSEGLIAKQEAVKEKQVVDEFQKEAVTGGLATYGVREIEEALEVGKARLLLVSDDLVLRRLELRCSKGGESKTVVLKEDQKPDYVCSCGGKFKAEKEVNLVDELIEKAESSGVEVEIISRTTSSGAQFLGMFHGLGAFLRYK
ncbi:MAG: hypothetical protein ACE5DI_03780, partial [Candidatus Micrarchaeia archaeon]